MKFLDCTLRDGGYYTNWNFDSNVVDSYLNAIEKLPVDVIEVGYRSKQLENYKGEFYYTPVQTLEKINRLAPSKKIAIMFNEVDIDSKMAVELLDGKQQYIDIIRLAVKYWRMDEAIKLATSIKEMGYEVAFNLMYMSEWMENEEVRFLVHS